MQTLGQLVLVYVVWGKGRDPVVENEGDIVPNLEVRTTWPAPREL